MTDLFSSISSAPPQGLTPMVRQYYDIKAQYKDCLLLFRLGDFYELFFDDAIKAAGLLDITLTRRGRKDDDDIPMCGIPFHAAESYIARLVKQGQKVAICEQMESPEEAKKRGHKSIVQRDVVRVITAGTLTEDTLLQPKCAHYLVALCHDKNRIALAATDISTGVFFRQVCRIEDVEGALSRLNPKELLIMEGSHQLPTLFDCLAGYKNQITLQPPSRFDAANGELTLKKRYSVHDLSALGSWDLIEIKAAGALINYISLTQKDHNVPLQIPQKIHESQYLQMDAATQRNLELFHTLDGDREGSLLATIDYTLTSSGSRLLNHALAFPMTNLDSINNRLNQVTHLVQQNNMRSTLRETLKNSADGERILSRLSLSRGGPRDIKAIQSVLRTGRCIWTCLKNDSPESPLKSFMNDLIRVPDLEDKIDRMLVDSPSPFARDGNFIRPGYLPELDTMRQMRDHGRETIGALQAHYIRDTGIASLKIKFNMILGYYIEITASHKDRVPETFIHRQTLVNTMRYTTPELNDIQVKLNSAADRCLHIELTLFQDLTQNILDHTDGLRECMRAISQIDLISGLAELAMQHNYVRPQLLTTPHLRITKGRHPVVERLTKNIQTPFMANSCCLDDQSYIQLLTGPNMAGKSTYLRQNALIILLAHIGSFVPAEQAEIGLTDRLFSRVGAADNLARAQSTFMVEMVETAAIINQSTKRSFVILDEMGRGTSTYDGIALAWSTLEYLHNRIQCRSLFATHYHELTTLSTSLPALRCVTMQIKEWDDKIIFLHTVTEGTANRSYGIHVAELAGLPASLIQRAKEILIGLESKETSSIVIAPAGTSLPIMNQEEEAVLHQLRRVDVECLSSREALEMIYSLTDSLHTQKKTSHVV